MSGLGAKKIIAPALNAMTGGPSRVFQQTHRIMEEAANALASRAVASGNLRPDVDPMDMLRAIYGGLQRWQHRRLAREGAALR